MAEIVLSWLFDKLASEALREFTREMGVDTEIKKWQRSLLQIQDVLIDASRKEITNQSVKRWLNGLQHLAYDIDDILDDLATEAMHHELSDQSDPLTSKVRKLMSTKFTSFSPRTNYILKEKLDDITTKLQDLVEEKKDFCFIVKDERPKNINRKLQTSLVDVSSIVGRQGDKEALVRKLLEPCDQNFSVVPIVGMGGVGKTTLARLLYDEKQVKDHFELYAWVCVSYKFDSFNITKVIFQSVGGENKEFADLNLLQLALRDKLMDRRFLLVLDDVWSESYEDWDTLVGPFHACAPGSKIIMTTRKEQLHALCVNNFNLHPTLKSHGEGIVKKCDGLPLALIALGRLLRTKKDEEVYWEKVLNSEIWRLQDGGGITAALRLSYHDLSAHLKQLFAYCSLFPKDYMFDRDDLVRLWMAEGFLHQLSPIKSNMEQLGNESFDELLSRSFFQHAPNNNSLFVMHDLMNDLATSVAGDFFLRLENNMENDIRKKTLEKYRHLSFIRERYDSYKKFEAFTGAKSLRTFLATSVGVVKSWQCWYLSSKVLADLLPELPLLRVLCLSCYMIHEVPESVGNLKHLRYLNLSQTKITHLSENVGNLYNLETLILFGCHDLIKLPKSFTKLRNLRHFDIRDTPLLNNMPTGIGQLKGLQTLSKIIIGGGNGFEITELEGLKNLRGEISIVGLEKVKNVSHLRELNFSQKIISELRLVWSDVFDGSREEIFEKEVFNELKPHNVTLKQLKIMSYAGIELPNWVGDPSFLQLKHVSISGCKECLSLPPLGQLDSLKELFIKGLNGVKVVGLELLGTGVAFRSLEILSFEDMKGWREWSTNGSDVFPCLRELYIIGCKKLDVISVEAIPSLRVLNITTCGNSVLRSMVHVAPSLTKLVIKLISGLTDEVWGGVIESLVGVEELSIWNCKEIRYLWESEAKASMVLVNLRKLEVWLCDNLVRLFENEEEDNGGNNLMMTTMMTSLKMLRISYCDNMKCCSCPNNIESLTFWECDSMTDISFPTGGGQKLKSLNITGCFKLMEEELGGENSSVLINNSSTAMLEEVTINGWVNLKSIVDLNCYVHLIRLVIKDCESLESFPDLHFSNLTFLNEVVIRNCPSMDASFPRGVWPPNLKSLDIGQLKKPISEWGQQNFPTSLFDLTLRGGVSAEEDDVIDFSQLSHLLPSSSLTCLCIDEFKKLETVSMGLQHLTSLKHLQIDECPKVMDLPEMLFPSLLSLEIAGCEKLKERCSKNGRGSYYYWPRISHIPKIQIDYKLQ